MTRKLANSEDIPAGGADPTGARCSAHSATNTSGPTSARDETGSASKKQSSGGAQKGVNGILIPTSSTLEKYGITKDEWLQLLASSGYVCGVCGNKPPSGRLFTDHEHVRGWKNMAPTMRKRFVRGLACYVCNRFVLNHRISAKLLRSGADYLDAYEKRSQEEGV